MALALGACVNDSADLVDSNTVDVAADGGDLSGDDSPAMSAGADVVTIEPLLVVDQTQGWVPRSQLWLGADRQEELLTFAQWLDTEADLGVIRDADPEQVFWVTGSYFCSDGGRVLDIGQDVLATRLTDPVDCAQPDPHTSIFQVERSAVSPTFDVVAFPDFGEPSTVTSVVDWVADETETMTPSLVVPHADTRVSEIRTQLFVGEDDIAELRALVLELNPAADVSLLDNADPEQSLFVAGGYYCDDGTRRLDVSQHVLVTYFEQGVLCESARPTVTIFEVSRSAVNPTFRLFEAGDWQPKGDGQLVALTKDWQVTD